MLPSTKIIVIYDAMLENCINIGTYLLLLALYLWSRMQDTTITTTRHTMTPNMNPARPEIPITLGSDCIIPSDPSLCSTPDEDEAVEDINTRHERHYNTMSRIK